MLLYLADVFPRFGTLLAMTGMITLVVGAMAWGLCIEDRKQQVANKVRWLIPIGLVLVLLSVFIPGKKSCRHIAVVYFVKRSPIVRCIVNKVLLCTEEPKAEMASGTSKIQE